MRSSLCKGHTCADGNGGGNCVQPSGCWWAARVTPVQRLTRPGFKGGATEREHRGGGKDPQ